MTRDGGYIEGLKGMGIRHRPRVYGSDRRVLDLGQPAGDDDQNSNPQDQPMERAVEAPIIWFDGVPIYGASAAGGRITLETIVQDLGPNGTVSNRRVAVAHLRFGFQALESLERAILGIRAVIGPSPEPDPAGST